MSDSSHAHDPDGFNDPASWDRASYSPDYAAFEGPAEVEPNEYRECALHFLELLHAVDEFMSRGAQSRKWIAVSMALGLRSTRGRTETSIAIEWGVTRAAVSKDVVMVLRLAHLEDNPAWGLKTIEHRRTLMRTNGARPHQDEVPEHQNQMIVS